MKLSITAAAGALTVALGGCYDQEQNYADNGYNAASNEAYAANESGNGYAQAPAGDWPEGARIVVEDNVTYRIDPDGARIALGPDGPRVEVIDGVRYRIDPGGTRVRIDEQGAVVRLPVGENVAVEVNTE